MALFALLLCNDAMGVSETPAGLRSLPLALHYLLVTRERPQGCPAAARTRAEDSALRYRL
jgi:hypothetical protein